MRSPEDPNRSPYDRFMARRRRTFRREAIIALLVLAVFIALGVWRRETGGFQGPDWTLNPQLQAR